MPTDGSQTTNIGKIKALGIRNTQWHSLLRKQFYHDHLFDCPKAPIPTLEDETEKQIKFESDSQLPIKIIKDAYNQTPWYIRLPQPLLEPGSVEKQRDECTELLKAKRRYHKELKYFKSRHKSTKHKPTRASVFKRKIVLVPQYFVDLSDYYTFQDPDTWFSGNYNWYYTGGTLDTVKLGNEDYLISTQFNNICVANICQPEECFLKAVYEETPIFNLQSRQYDDGFLVILRQKQNISLKYFLLQDDVLSTSGMWKYSSRAVPFVDVCSNVYDVNKLMTLDIVRNLKIRDLTQNKSSMQYAFEKKHQTMSDLLAQCGQVDENTVCYMDRCCIYLLDLRSLTVKTVCTREGFLKCDNLCALEKTMMQNNHLLFSTTHSILSVDLRMMKPVDKVKHMLLTPPLLLKTLVDNGKEFICASGQYHSEKVLLRRDSHAFGLPEYIPNPLDTVQQLHLTRGMVFNDMLKHRLQVSTTGAKLIKRPESEDIELYTSTAFGDVFKQSISKSHNDSSEPIDHLQKWLERLPIKPKTIVANTVCNMSDAFFAITAHSIRTDGLKRYTKEQSMPVALEDKLILLNRATENHMDSIWKDEGIGVEEVADNLPASVAPRLKVAEWLHASVYN